MQPWLIKGDQPRKSLDNILLKKTTPECPFNYKVTLYSLDDDSGSAKAPSHIIYYLLFKHQNLETFRTLHSRLKVLASPHQQQECVYVKKWKYL